MLSTWQEYKEEILTNGLNENWYVLGIDLGTTNSIISYWNKDANKPEAIDISNGFGKIPLPSVVQYREEYDEWIVGEEAYRSIKLYPESTIRSIKRKMGSNETIRLNDHDYLPEEISAKILVELTNHVKNINPKAELAGLVVSVPYDFDDAAKKATRRACELAGFGDKLICLIEEPKAALLAYNFRHDLKDDEKIMVFDFGGGTFDITIFHVHEEDDKNLKLQVISEGGKAFHGGDNIDDVLLEYCFSLIENKNNQSKDDIAIENQVGLSVLAREAKERLSGLPNFRIPFTFCIPPFAEPLSKDEFEELIKKFMDETRKLVLKTLRETYTGAVQPENIDRVLLEGGSSQMPWVKDMLQGIFTDEEKIYSSERPALDISLGATYYAAMKMGLLDHPDMETEQYIEFEVTVPHDIGFLIENHNKKSFFTMIRRGTPYALAKKTQQFTLSADSEEEMTSFTLTILERMNVEDTVEDCSLIGEVVFKDLPKRPSGKTKLHITLSVEEEGGLVKGAVKDMGFLPEFPPSTYAREFSPERFEKTIVQKI